MEYMIQVENYLCELDYDVKINKKTGVYHFLYEGTTCAWTTFMEFDIGADFVTIYCKRKDVISSEFHDTIIRYFNSCNIRLSFGAFYLDTKNGELYFRISQDLYSDVLNPVEILDNSLRIALQVMDNYNAGVNALIEHKTMEEAFQNVIQEEESYDIFEF